MSTEFTDDDRFLLDCFEKRFKAEAKTYALGYGIPGIDFDAGFRVEMAKRAGKMLAFQFIHDVYCLGQKETTVSFSVPSTWLDALLDEYQSKIPRWLRNKIKVKHNTLSKTVQATALLPGIPVEVNGRSIYVVARTLDTPIRGAKPQPERSPNEK